MRTQKSLYSDGPINDSCKFRGVGYAGPGGFTEGFSAVIALSSRCIIVFLVFWKCIGIRI